MAGVFILSRSCGTYSFYILFLVFDKHHINLKNVFLAFMAGVFILLKLSIYLLYINLLILTAGFNILYLPTGFKTYSFIF